MHRILAASVCAVALMSPALAEEPALATSGTPTTLGALLDSGYQIISTFPLSGDDQKAIWPNDTIGAYVMVVLQRGPSIGSCVMATSSVINVAPSAIGAPNGCRVR